MDTPAAWFGKITAPICFRSPFTVARPLAIAPIQSRTRCPGAPRSATHGGSRDHFHQRLPERLVGQLLPQKMIPHQSHDSCLLPTTTMPSTGGNDFRPTISAIHLDGGAYLPRLRREWGDFLKGFGWSHFLILTAREASSPGRLLSRFMVYVRSLERIAQCRIGWFVAVEESNSGWGHLHALTTGTEHLTVPA